MFTTGFISSILGEQLMPLIQNQAKLLTSLWTYSVSRLREIQGGKAFDFNMSMCFNQYIKGSCHQFLYSCFSLFSFSLYQLVQHIHVTR